MREPVPQHRVPLGPEVLLQQAGELRGREHGRPRGHPAPGGQVLRARVDRERVAQRPRQLRQDGALHERVPLLGAKHLARRAPRVSGSGCAAASLRRSAAWAAVRQHLREAER